ncbi:MAG: hypothetical protein HYX34_10055 [Actinobacteria bacterium]|nr:hypothetical protein [Actinomycetota bacterium]
MATVIGLAVALWGFAIGLRQLFDNSFLTHLATGRIIVSKMRVPTRDPYSFTASGRPWTVFSWFASLAYGLSERLAGLGAIRVLHALLAGAAMLAIWRLSRPARSLVGRLASVVLPGAVATGLWTHRPFMFGVVGLALVLVVLDSDVDPRWLVPVMWVWVNSHGSFPLAVAAVGAVALGARLDGGHARRELRVLAWVLVGIVAGAVNPIGPRILASPFELLGKSADFRSVVEWQAPRFSDASQLAALAQLLVAVLLLVRRPRWRTALPLVVFAGLALTSARNLPLLSLVLVPGMAQAIGDTRLASGLDGRRRSPATALGAAAVVIVALVLASAVGPQQDMVLSAYPLGALRAADRAGVSRRLVTQDFVGNLRELRDGPRGEVFIDDRVDMYPSSVIADYELLLKARAGWDGVLRRWRADGVLWSRNQPLAQVLAESGRWRLVYRDRTWVLFVPAR